MAEIHITEQTTPTTPQANKTKLYVDSVDSHLKTIDDTGTIIDITDTTTPVDNLRGGFLVYSDLATGTTPISHTGGVDTPLTNDEAGAQTLKTFSPVGITDVWNSVGGVFDFSELSNGDWVDVRLNLSVTTTSINQEIDVSLELGQGGTSFIVPFFHNSYKSVSEYPVGAYDGFYIGDDNIRLNEGQFIFSSDDDATIEVIGWVCKILIRG